MPDIAPLAAAPQPTERPLGFPRSLRLTASTEYKRVFAKPQRLDAGGFLVLVRPNGACAARLGLAIAKRPCPRASDRNRLKRIARESFRTHYSALPAVDIVVLCTPKARHIENRQLFDGLARAWAKIGARAWAALPS